VALAERLIECARDLVDLSALPATDPVKTASGRGLYRDLRKRVEDLTRLVAPLAADDAKLDVLLQLLIGALECVRRQMEIELDFIAPITFLQEHPYADAPIVDFADLRQQLSGYVAFHHDLSGARWSLLIMKDPGRGGVLVEAVGNPPAILATKAQITEYLRSTLIGAEPALAKLGETAGQFLEQEPQTDGVGTLDPIPSGTSTVGELIHLEDDSNLYAALFFAHERGATPDPSKRTVSRVIPQVLLSEFMRTTQTQRLLSLIFHHISAPVSAMRIMLLDLSQGYIPPEEQPDYFSTLLLLVEDSLLMIRNHQNYVRMARGISPLIDITPFDIVAEAEFRRRMINYKYKSAQHSLHLEAPSSLQVRLDRLLVGDIIQNLLDNACKYSPAYKQVQMVVERDKRNVYITVIDQGPGLPANAEASFYLEGVRGASTSNAREGLGLGLFMVQQYAHWLNGDVWYERIDAHLTKFTVRLPTEVRS
jgi:signal transduction histidine kinase